MDQTITCPTCGDSIPLTQALRGEIESSLKREFERAFNARERDLQRGFDAQLEEARRTAEKTAALKAARTQASELADLKDRLKEQTDALEAARTQERELRKRERDLERAKTDLELTVDRKLDEERAKLVVDTQERLATEHRLKDAEKERQLPRCAARSRT